MSCPLLNAKQAKKAISYFCLLRIFVAQITLYDADEETVYLTWQE